jgi:hypothetical protein
MPLWDQVKSNLVEWYTVAADKTEELAKIGVRRYDKFGISRDVERQFTELGSFVYNAVAEGKQDFLSDPTLAAIIERIKGLEADLKQKEEEIEEIRRVHREKSTSQAEAATAQSGAKLDSAVSESGAAAGVLVEEGLTDASQDGEILAGSPEETIPEDKSDSENIKSENPEKD